MAEAGTTNDGRVARRERNRIAVLEAVIDLFEEGNLDPAVEDVSERSGVSTRSVYRYFHHRNELIRAAMAHLMQRVLPRMELADVGIGSLDDRIERFVAHRIEMYVALAPLTRAARRAASAETLVSNQFEAGRVMLRQQLMAHFAPEFDSLSGTDLALAVVGVDLAYQFDAFEYLYASLDANTEQMATLLADETRMHFAALAERSLI